MSADDVREALGADERWANDGEIRPPAAAPTPGDDTELRGIDPHALQAGTDELSDLANAEHFVAHHRDDVRHVLFGETGRWFCYDGRRWAPDRARVERLAHGTARAIVSAHDTADRETIKLARRAQSAAGLAAMLRTAESMLDVQADAFDVDPWALNVANGTLDLRSGALLPHRREDLLTKLSLVAYDSSATHPTWDRFLAEVQPDPEIRAFLQRLAGYAITGEIREHVLAINYGSGRNGKGVFMNALLRAAGDYGIAVAPEVLMLKRGEAHPTERADLFGVRLASSQETKEGAALDVAMVKALTGGDPIRARRMRENFWQFNPTHQLWMSTNHKPQINETKNAIWERVLLIPWSVEIPRERRDPNLGSKLDAEASGVLAWIVEGVLLYLQHGLAPPASVVAAGEAYRAQQDTLGAFLAERCVLAPDVKVTRSALYATYRKWAERQGEDPAELLNARAFAEKIREHGCEDVTSVRGTGPTPERGWRGIRTKTRHEEILDEQAAEASAADLN